MFFAKRMYILPILAMCAIASEPESNGRINAVIQAWEQGRAAVGRGVVDFSFDEAVRFSAADLDFLFCDMEHRPLDFNQMRVFLQALLDRRQILERGTRLIRPTPLLRIPAYGRERNQWMIKQALDLGVPGIICPTVSTAAEVENIVAAARYPQPQGAHIPEPEGLRGVSPDMAMRYWGLSLLDYAARADLYPLNPRGETLIIVQIEDKRAIHNLDEILKVKGLGMVMIGPADLSFSLGHPGHPEDPEVESAVQQVLAKAKRAGVPCGIVNPPSMALERARQGFQWISTGELDAATLRQVHSVRIR